MSNDDASSDIAPSDSAPSDSAPIESGPAPSVRKAEDAAPTRPGLFRGAGLILLVVVVACLGGAVASWVGGLLREPEPTETLVVRPTADVVVAMRDLARLESSSYHVERVIDLSSEQQRFGGLLQAEDSILLIAAADVVAGVDLAQMQDGDVIIEPDARRVTITLPPVEILSARLDNDRTYVHRRETDLLARRRESLETEARREAERTLRQAAIDTGILDRAERNAARTIEALVRSLGYEHVDVRFRDREE